MRGEILQYDNIGIEVLLVARCEKKCFQSNFSA